MKRTILLFLCLPSAHCLLGQSQTPIQPSNGVIILSSQGVEATRSTPAFKPSPSRTTDDWSLPECEDALRHIEQKIAGLSPQDESYESTLAYYKEEQAKIMTRRETLQGNAR